VSEPPADASRPPGLLGDTRGRDYAVKLDLFAAYAAPELRATIAGLGLRPGDSVLDAGCGSGGTLGWLAEGVAPGGFAAGIDLAAAHAAAAQRRTRHQVLIVQGDLADPPFSRGRFDVVFCLNTLHHLREPARGVEALRSLLRPGGRFVVAQSAFLPEQLFAWDARLERITHAAVREYYRSRYGGAEHAFNAVRALLGLLRGGGLERVSIRTCLIERVAPLDASTERYLSEAIFRDTWGERLRSFMPAEDFEKLTRLTDPSSPDFALRRSDFHYLQTLTIASGIKDRR